MGTSVAGRAALTVGLVAATLIGGACVGDSGRSLPSVSGPPGGRLRWDAAAGPDASGLPRTDAAVPYTDDAAPNADAASGAGDSGAPDAGRRLLDEGELCVADSECRIDLDCVLSRCTAVGGDGEPCGVARSCDPGLVCAPDRCRPAISARFCHCIFGGSFDRPIQLTMEIEGASLGPVWSNECSPCAPMPWGTDLAFRVVRSSGTELDYGTMSLSGDMGDVMLSYDVSGMHGFAIECTRTLSNVCGI